MNDLGVSCVINLLNHLVMDNIQPLNYNCCTIYLFEFVFCHSSIASVLPES